MRSCRPLPHPAPPFFPEVGVGGGGGYHSAVFCPSQQASQVAQGSRPLMGVQPPPPFLPTSTAPPPAALEGLASSPSRRPPSGPLRLPCAGLLNGPRPILVVAIVLGPQLSQPPVHSSCRSNQVRVRHLTHARVGHILPASTGHPRPGVTLVSTPAAFCHPVPLPQTPPARGCPMHGPQAAHGSAPLAQPSPAAGHRRYRRSFRRAPFVVGRWHPWAARSSGGLLIRPEGGLPHPPNGNRIH